jgi:hypothetical protein
MKPKPLLPPYGPELPFRFLTDKLHHPAVQAQLSQAQRDTATFAVGVWPQFNTDIKHILGQYSDSDYDLLQQLPLSRRYRRPRTTVG